MNNECFKHPDFISIFVSAMLCAKLCQLTEKEIRTTTYHSSDPFLCQLLEHSVFLDSLASFPPSVAKGVIK